MTYLDLPLSGFRFTAFWDETSNILKRKDLCDRKRKTAEKLVVEMLAKLVQA